jgi:hypothetical protein
MIRELGGLYRQSMSGTAETRGIVCIGGADERQGLFVRCDSPTMFEWWWANTEELNMDYVDDHMRKGFVRSIFGHKK